MLKEQNRIIRESSRLADVALTVFSFVFAYFVKKHLLPEEYAGLAQTPNYYIILLMIVIIWYLVLRWFGVYASMRRKRLRTIVRRNFNAVMCSFVFLTFFMYLFHIESVSRMMLMIFVVTDLILLTAYKTAVYTILKKYRSKGLNSRNILIIGSKERAKDVLSAIIKNRDAGYIVIGCLDIEISFVGKEVAPGIDVVNTVQSLENVLKHNVVDELVVAMPLKLLENADRYLLLAEEMGVNVRFIPDWQVHGLMYKPEIATAKLESFFEIPTMAFHMTPPDSGPLLIKNIIDYTVALTGLIMISPLMTGIAILIKLFSKGPVFYTQPRFGKNGRIFNVYKFRTMITGADCMLDELRGKNEADGPVFKIEDDPRIIPYIGTFLRKTSLDELPQLFNVLKGEMSLVGPRPPIIEEVDHYAIWQRRRLSMKPGITCVWQVTPNRNEVSFDDWMKMDLEYIDKWSLFLDTKILLKTARAVLFGNGR